MIETPLKETSPLEFLAPNDEKRPTPYRICFVCTGNTCRSPMAEAVASFYLQKNAPCAFGERPVECFSAGLYAVVGDSISPNAVLALERAGIEPSATRNYRDHRAHTLTEEEAERYDLLVGLSQNHAMELIFRFPSCTSRVTALQPPVSDPYGGDLARYESALGEISRGVKALLFGSQEDESCTT